MAGVLLSFGNLLSEIVSAGSPGLNSSNPGLVKILSGFVFPVGLVMWAPTLNLLVPALLRHVTVQDSSKWSRTSYE